MDLGEDEKAREIRVGFRGSRRGKQACRSSPERKGRAGGGLEQRGRPKGGNERSGGAVEGSHFVEELSRHQTGPENLACVVASRRFQVEGKEGMEEVVGQEGQQQKTFDGVGVMAKDVIGVPLLGELLESVILISQRWWPNITARWVGSWAAGAVVTQIQSLLSSSGLESVAVVPCKSPGSESPAPASAPAQEDRSETSHHSHCRSR